MYTMPTNVPQRLEGMQACRKSSPDAPGIESTIAPSVQCRYSKESRAGWKGKEYTTIRALMSMHSEGHHERTHSVDLSRK